MQDAHPAKLLVTHDAFVGVVGVVSSAWDVSLMWEKLASPSKPLASKPLAIKVSQSHVVQKADAATTIGGAATIMCVGEEKAVEGENAVEVASKRHGELFAQAIREYDWKLAEALASSDAEMQDLSDSRLRVGVLTAALESGDLALASEYAITNEEFERISSSAGHELS